MEAIIFHSLSNNNEERQRATEHISEMMKSPTAFQEFWSVVVNSSNSGTRQAAATYFYRIVLKKKKWNQLPLDVRCSIKTSILERIHQEPEKKVKTIIIRAAGQIALMEPDNWPELFRLLEETVGVEGFTEMRELGMFVVSVLTEHTPTLFELHVSSLLHLFGSVLSKPENYGTPLGYLTVLSMKNILHYYPKKEKTIAQSFEYLMPSVLEVVKAQSSRNRPDRSIECVEFFEALLLSYPRIICSNLKNVIDGLLRAAVFLNVNEISCRFIDVISTIICYKTKKVAKEEAVLQTLCQTLYEIISSPKFHSENKDHYDVYSGDVNLTNAAVDLLDTLTVEIEPELLMKHIMPILDAGAAGEDVFRKKAVFLILGILVERCPEQVRSNGVDRILIFIKESLNSDHPILLNGAIFTFARFVEHLKPDINVYLLDFITLLLQFLSDLDGKFKQIEGHLVPRIFFVLCESCETLDTSIEPLLPFMVPILLSVVTSNTKIHYRELAINIIGHAGVATKKNFREYFSSVLEVLRLFLVDNLPEDHLPLQVQTFDTLGTLFKSLYVKGDEFQLVEEVLNVTMTITEQKNCGELRSGLYSMLSDCSEFMKENMESYFPRILKLMTISFHEIDTTDGEITGNEFYVPSVISGDDSYEKKSTPVRDLKIIEEKEEALMALGNIAFNCGIAFKPYLHDSFMICLGLTNHENNVIRAAAMEAVTNLFIAIKRCYQDNDISDSPNWDLIPKLCSVIEKDENVDVVFSVLDGFQKMIKEIPQILNVSYAPTKEESNNTTVGSLIAGVVKTVITEKASLYLAKSTLKKNLLELISYLGRVTSFTSLIPPQCTCQKLKEEDSSDDDDDDDDNSKDGADKEEEIEDNYSVEDLVTSAQDIIPLLGEYLPRATFLHFFFNYQRHLLKLLKKNQPTEIRESTTATLAICMKFLEEEMETFAIEFFPTLPTLMIDASDGVRNNVAYCVTQMITYGRDKMFSYYTNLSNSFLIWLQNERCSMVVDNICGAIASMIAVNKNLLNLNNILPIFFRFLPLREDFEENAVVFSSFLKIFDNKNHKEYLVKAVEVVLLASINKQVTTDEARHTVLGFFQMITTYYEDDKEWILRSLPEDLKSHFVAAL